MKNAVYFIAALLVLLVFFFREKLVAIGQNLSAKGRFSTDPIISGQGCTEISNATGTTDAERADSLGITTRQFYTLRDKCTGSKVFALMNREDMYDYLYLRIKEKVSALEALPETDPKVKDINNQILYRKRGFSRQQAFAFEAARECKAEGLTGGAAEAIYEKVLFDEYGIVINYNLL